MAKKRIIEQTASTTISNDDWLIKDSPTDGTTKIQASVFKTLMNEGMASDEDLADAIENIAGEYDSEVEYSKDALCFKDGVLYIANADTTGTWDSTKWDATTIADIIANLRIDANDVVDVIVKGDSLVNSSKIAVLDSLTAQGSASGSIASFSDGSTHPMSKLEVGVEPQQDLNGYDAPWVGGAGKNKFNCTATTQTKNQVTFTINNDGTVSLSGTASATASVLLGTITLSAGTYILSGGVDNDIYLNIQNPVYYSKASETQFTVESETTFYMFATVYQGVNATGKVLKPMIRLSTVSDSTFAPYSNICPISGWDDVNVTVCGANIWDEEWELGIISNTTGEDVSDSTHIRSKNYISCKPNTTYYIKCGSSIGDLRLCFYDINKNFISSLNGTSWNYEHTTPNNCYYMRWCNVFASATTYNNDISFNYPSTDTEYHAYNGQTYNVEFKDGSNPLTVYGGTLDVVSGELVVDRASVVFDGSNDETWASDTDVTSADGIVCFRAYLQNNNIKKPEGTISAISYIGKMLSNTMPTLKNGYVNQYPMANTVMGITAYSGATNNYFYINTNKTLSNIQSVAELRAWLAENPTTVCYELATPQTYQLTPTQVKSLLGTNNVWSDTGEIINLEYVRDATSTINDILARIKALEEA